MPHDLDQLCVTTLRLLAVDMVEAAKSGHPGLPLGAAPMAYVLWARGMNHNPANPHWANRDRFVLSAGHGSALLYALLHCFGYGLSLDECRNFRQWRSQTPGHPEYRHTPGVEVTTGPLGQGIAMAVGLALAERFLATQFNRPGLPLIDHRTYALVSDGDLMEGISHEAASLAGHQRLGKLICLYDDNGITIDGPTTLAFTEDVGKRFEAYGWQVLRVADGNDLAAIETALQQGQEEKARPTLIMVKTQIGYGSPKAGTAAAHGEPLGTEAAEQTYEFYGRPAGATFTVPAQAGAHFAAAAQRGAEAEAVWTKLWQQYGQAHPLKAQQFSRQWKGELPPGWSEALPLFKGADGTMATRQASHKVINALAARLPHLIGGSADLAPSNKTLIQEGGVQSAETPAGHNFHFGVREQAMAAALNGLALHGGVIPYGATFLVFSDYLRGSLRLSALMGLRSIYLFTHDSLAVGEDGPTHQPVEQLPALRALPGLTVIRPADANETAVAWRLALEENGPTALILSRQSLPILEPALYPVREGVSRGGYILADASGPLRLILIASGSEVHLALAAREKLQGEGIGTRVVSLPSWELFDRQPLDYRQQVLPPVVPARLAIEAASPLGWERYVGAGGAILGVDRFGASAPGEMVLEKYGFHLENVRQKALGLLSRK